MKRDAKLPATGEQIVEILDPVNKLTSSANKVIDLETFMLDPISWSLYTFTTYLLGLY